MMGNDGKRMETERKKVGEPETSTIVEEVRREGQKVKRNLLRPIRLIKLLHNPRCGGIDKC